MMTERRWPAWAVSGGLAVVLVAVGLGKYGIGLFPQWMVMLDIAAHWQDPRAGEWVQPYNDYLMGNSAGAVLSGVLHLAGSKEAFGLSQLTLTVVAIVFPFLMPAARRAPELAWALFVMLAGGPVVAVLLIWMDGYDPLTVIAASLIGLSRRPWGLAVGWFILGLNHSTMAALALVAWLPVFWLVAHDASRRRRLETSAAALAAALAGALTTMMVLGIWGGATKRRFVIPLSDYGRNFLEQYAWTLGWIALSAFGIGWTLIVHLRLRRVRGSGLLLALGLAFALVVPFRGLDATRDIALPLLPALLVVLAGAFGRQGVTTLPRGWWFAYGTAAVLVPTLVVFGFEVASLGWWN